MKSAACDLALETYRSLSELTIETTAEKWKEFRSMVAAFAAHPNRGLRIPVKDTGALRETTIPPICAVVLKLGDPPVAFRVSDDVLVIEGPASDLEALAVNVDFPSSAHGAHTHYGPWFDWIAKDSVEVTFQHVVREGAP